MKLLVTGSSGLIGSEVCTFFAKRDHEIHGVDNNQRAIFFGPQGDTGWNLNRLREAIPEYQKRILRMCMEAYDKVGIIRNVIDLMGDFAVQGMTIVHPNKNIERFYRKYNFKK